MDFSENLGRLKATIERIECAVLRAEAEAAKPIFLEVVENAGTTTRSIEAKQQGEWQPAGSFSGRPGCENPQDKRR